MGLLDVLPGWAGGRGRRGGSVDGPRGFAGDDLDPDEPGEGAPPFLADDLAALRWTSQQEAVNVGRMDLEPERWAGGRMSFEWERAMAHEHEGLRDRLANHVSAAAREETVALYGLAGRVACARDALRDADRDLGVITHSWNKVYRDVHSDELELDRYFRLKSRTHSLFKWLIAVALFLTEIAVSTALFDQTVADDVPAYPFLFALGLILILIVVPHYAAIGLKDGVSRYHEAELDAFDASDEPVPIALRRKARLEEVEDRGIRFVAAVAGLALVALFIPLSSLRGTHLGDGDQPVFWFSFFFLLQACISAYFFLREWMDYGTAALNLRHQEEAKQDAENWRQKCFDQYTDAVAEFMQEAQQLLFLYRDAPRWDSYVVQTYLATVHYFRHVVSVTNPELDVFIRNATVPRLAPGGDGVPERDLDASSSEHPGLAGDASPFSRGWWLREMGAALAQGSSPVEPPESGDPSRPAPAPAVFENPHRLLAHFLEFHGSSEAAYRRPEVLDHIEDAPDHYEPGSSVPPPAPAQANGAIEALLPGTAELRVDAASGGLALRKGGEFPRQANGEGRTVSDQPAANGVGDHDRPVG